MDTENLIALATEEDTIPCNEDRNIKQGLSKRSKLGTLTVVVVLLVGLGLTSVAVQQKSPLQASTNNFIQENMDQDMLNAVNHERKRRGVSALCYNSKLMNAAAVHSKDMARHQKMSHTGSDGSSASKRVTRAGYSWNRVAENVAMGQSSVSSVMHTWMNSAGHKRNILNSQYTQFGYAKSGRYWTQVFGASRSESCSGGRSACKSTTSYGGRTVPGCTKEGHHEAWCSKVGGGWRACTASDNACSFPFTYKGTKYWKCANKGHSRPWCSKVGGGWKNC